MNRYINMFKYACDMVYYYNINCRLTVVIDGSMSIRDLESKVLYDRSEPLKRFWGHIESAYFRVCGKGFRGWLGFG